MLSKLKLKRLNQGITQKDIAERMKMFPSTVSQQEKKGIKTLRVAERYAKILNCDPLELLG